LREQATPDGVSLARPGQVGISQLLPVYGPDARAWWVLRDTTARSIVSELGDPPGTY